MSGHAGSRKCILELLSSDNYLSHINSIIQDISVIITTNDIWMPKGLDDPKETQLKDFLKANYNPAYSEDIIKWWLHVDATTPNWDLVSTCTIEGEKGILLVEAKAHCDELNEETKGKPFNKTNASENSRKNHIKIGDAIDQARSEINRTLTKVSISRDNCYQLSNRIAHAWWLASKGIPVVLLYLGFLNAEDMNYGGRVLFKKPADWEECFMNHAKQVGVDKIVEEWVDCGESKFKTICRST